MVKIIWIEDAVEDLEKIGAFIALDKPEAADKLFQRVGARVAILATHPNIGPRIPELLPQSRFRQLVEPPCRIFYRYELRSRTVYILGVMRGEKLFQKRLLHRRDNET